MRIVLNQSEIELAIEDFITRSVNVPDDHNIDIDLKATRGDEGYQAYVDLTPVTGSPHPVDERIQPTEEAVAEGLGIVEKIEAAKKEQNAPRRRGRPPGSKNKPKVDDGTEAPQTASAQIAIPAEEPVAEPEPEVTEEEALAAEAARTEPQEEPVQELVEEAQEPVEEVEQEDTTPAAAPTVAASEVSTQASPELVENVSQPEPEEAPAEAPVEEAPAKPTRSLFANLPKPSNG